MLFTKEIYTTLTFKYHTLQIHVPIIGCFVLNSWALQSHTGITHHPAIIAFIIPLFPTVPVSTNPQVSTWVDFFSIFFFFLFLDSGLTFYLLLPGASSVSNDTILSPGVIFLPCFPGTFCFSTPISQCSLKTCNTESFKIPTLPSPRLLSWLMAIILKPGFDLVKICQ